MGHAPSTASGAKYYGAVCDRPPRREGKMENHQARRFTLQRRESPAEHVISSPHAITQSSI